MMSRLHCLALVTSLLFACSTGRAQESLKELDPNLKPKPIAPVPVEKLDAALRRGVQHLLDTQNKYGSWGKPSLEGGVAIVAEIGSHHAFGVAVTAMSVSALIETGGDRPEVLRAIERGETHLFAEVPKIRRADPTLIYNVWAHAYSIQALVRMHKRLPKDSERQEKIVALIRGQYKISSSRKRA